MVAVRARRKREGATYCTALSPTHVGGKKKKKGGKETREIVIVTSMSTVSGRKGRGGRRLPYADGSRRPRKGIALPHCPGTRPTEKEKKKEDGGLIYPSQAIVWPSGKKKRKEKSSA